MNHRLKSWLGNLGLLLFSIAATLLALEHAVFRHILVPDDVLENVSIHGVVRYAPSTRAVFRHPDGRETLVTTNAQGWNSTRPSYSPLRSPDRTRIAVIGDSYVHGAFVNVDQGFPELLEKRLGAEGLDVEVFRFGMDGAPLSQYLHMLRREVMAYRPDIVVVVLIHNDFDESYRLLKTRYASSFLKFTEDEAGRIVEVPPADFKPGTADLLRNSRMFRYLYYETDAYLHFKSLVNRLFWGGSEDWRPEFISSAVDIRRINDHPRNRRFARHVIAEMKRLADAEGVRLAFVMDGVREAVYEGRTPMDYEVGRLNQIAREITGELSLPFLDLQDTFQRDWSRNLKRFEFSYDWHWNEHANALVADAVARLLRSEPSLLPRLVPALAPQSRPGVRSKAEPASSGKTSGPL